MKPSLIIFDCDGVLIDSEPLAALAYERVYDRHGMAGVGPDIIAQCIGMKQADIIAKIRDITGHLLADDRQCDIWLETRQLFTERLEPTEGIAAFLDDLTVARCVASSSSMERIHHSLQVTGLARHSAMRSFRLRWWRAASPLPTSSCLPQSAWVSSLRAAS